MKTVLVTGASGFVGSALVGLLTTGETAVRSFRVRAVVRCREKFGDQACQWVAMGELDQNAAWDACCVGVDVVVHTAGRAHVFSETESNPMSAFMRVNCDATLALARAAVRAGVRRFVYISSIGVNGSVTRFDREFSETDIPEPSSAYGYSKLQAEAGLLEIAAHSGLEVVIVRPPLVYGPNCPGNFSRLAAVVKSGWPLPLLGLRNRRCFVGIDNLVDFISCVLTHPCAANQVFLVSDGVELSTADLVGRFAKHFGVPLRLYWMPRWLVRLLFVLGGRSLVFSSLFGDLRLDISKARHLLGWVPPHSFESSLARAFSEGHEDAI